MAAASLAAILSASACGTSPRTAPRAEDPGALIIPPLGPDAGPPASAEPAPEPAEVRTALTIRARDPRLARRQPRSRAFVRTEVQALERSLAAARAAAPDRPLLRRRLAEAYTELAWTSSGPDAARARDEAIAQYVGIKAESPQSPHMDEVLYYLGLSYELNGDLTSARRAYFDLIAKHPSSKLVPLALFAFGELFFHEAASDPSRNVLALQAYTEVLKHPPGEEDGGVHPDALLRIGETHLRMQHEAGAAESFARLRREFAGSDAAGKIPVGH